MSKITVSDFEAAFLRAEIAISDDEIAADEMSDETPDSSTTDIALLLLSLSGSQCTDTGETSEID